ncbi:MAG: 50S ribosomal protein L5 [Candidatus Micrarchaeota archaeon]|nr:50S ribosomal protein L5 [Candidatus Micrarchaeota archaeon]
MSSESESKIGQSLPTEESASKAKENRMLEVIVDKVTLNIGVGRGGQELENARTLLERLAGAKAVPTRAKVRNPVFRIKKGDIIGTKTTLRGPAAVDFVRKALKAKNFTLPSRSFDKEGNFSFGVPEYIEFPGAKYDPQIGMLGFDVCVTLRRRGFRVGKRRRAKAKIGRAHRLTKKDGIEFAKRVFQINVV